MVTAIIICFFIGAGISAMILAYFTDHEAAGATGVIRKGQVW